MFRFIVFALFALLATADAKPSLVAPLAYSVSLTYAAAPATAAVVGHASYVAPYASSYNAHQIAHSAAFPAAYAAAPVVHAAAPIVRAAYAAPLASPFDAPVLLKK